MALFKEIDQPNRYFPTDLLYTIAAAQAEAGDASAAMKTLAMIDSTIPSALLGATLEAIGTALISAGSLKEAETFADSARSPVPFSADGQGFSAQHKLCTKLAIASCNKGEFEKAKAFADKIQGLGLNAPVAQVGIYAHVATRLIDRGDLQEANALIEDSSRYALSEATRFALYEELCRAWLARNDMPNAKKAAERARKIYSLGKDSIQKTILQQLFKLGRIEEGLKMAADRSLAVDLLLSTVYELRRDEAGRKVP